MNMNRWINLKGLINSKNLFVVMIRLSNAMFIVKVRFDFYCKTNFDPDEMK